MRPSDAAPEQRYIRPQGPWLSSALLDDVEGLLHGFTLRAAGDFTEAETTERLLKVTGAKGLRLLHQVHGCMVAYPEDPDNLPVADAWVGIPAPGVLLGVRTADCLPVLYCHVRTRTLGLAHAGWRGAAAGIALKTLKEMSVPAEEVLVALGPSIGPCCYEVGEDVVSAVGRGSAHVREIHSGKYHFDLPGFVEAQIVSAGVPPERISRIGLCTASRTDVLFSYRAEARTGRLCSFLGWLEQQP